MWNVILASFKNNHTFFFLIQQMSMFDLYVGKIKHLVSWLSLKELGSVPDFMSKDLSLVACWSRLNAMQISLLWHQIINRAMLLLMLAGKKYLLLTEFKLFGRISYLHWTWTFLLLNQPNILFRCIRIGHELKGAESILLTLDTSVLRS